MLNLVSIDYKELSIKKGMYTWSMNIVNGDLIKSLDKGKFRLHKFQTDMGLDYFSLEVWEGEDLDIFRSNFIISKSELEKLKIRIKELNDYIINTSIRLPFNSEYYIINEHFKIEKCTENNYYKDDDKFEFKNYFVTKEIAKHYMDNIHKILKGVTNFIEYKRLDWRDNYYYLDEYFKPQLATESDRQEDLIRFKNNNYFESEELAQQCSNKVLELFNNRNILIK